MRGTAAGEPVVSQASTDAFREGYSRAIGEKPIQRGRWVFDPRVMHLVPADEYVPEPTTEARFAPILSDRYMEGTISPINGADIGSRRKRRDHMKRYDVVDHEDGKSEALRVQRDWQRRNDRERKEALRRAIYEVTEKRRNHR